MSYGINQQIEEAILPILPIPLLAKEKGSYYKVSTLLDSGSSTNWITEDLLKHLDHKIVGSTELEVYTLNSKEKRKFKLVEVYYTNNKEKKSIRCYAHEKYTQHTRVKGMVEFIKENSKGVSEKLLGSIIDPTVVHSDHSEISRGVGMVLCSAATNRLRDGESKTLKNIEVLLEPTIFGTAMSGKIPEKLRSKTEAACNFATIPRTVKKLKEEPALDVSDVRLEDRLEQARMKAKPEVYDKFMRNQTDWDTITLEQSDIPDTITAEVHQGKDNLSDDWAKEAEGNEW